MSLEKEFVPYPEALELKQLGFDEDCLGTYNVNGLVLPLKPYTSESKAPTYSQAFRFFRENYKLQTYIDFYHSESYFYKIKSQDVRNIKNTTGDIILQSSSLFTRTYEEAELACLRKLIQIVKNK